jgi:hypothetical protein
VFDYFITTIHCVVCQSIISAASSSSSFAKCDCARTHIRRSKKRTDEAFFLKHICIYRTGRCKNARAMAQSGAPSYPPPTLHRVHSNFIYELQRLGFCVALFSDFFPRISFFLSIFFFVFISLTLFYNAILCSLILLFKFVYRLEKMQRHTSTTGEKERQNKNTETATSARTANGKISIYYNGNY